jgi:hypothetical protein
MAISELFDALEKKVDEAKAKQLALDNANAAAKQAQDDYNAVLAEVNDLKGKMMSTISNILPDPRVRVAD